MQRFTRVDVQTATDCAYAAGLIDGEGCIRIHRAYQYHKDGTPNYYVEVMVNTSTPVLAEWLCARWGGRVTFLKTPGGFNKIGMCRWRVGSLRANAFLEDIYPYLVLKREQAMYARSFQALSTMHKGFKMYPEWAEMRDRLFQKVRDLKRDGKLAAPQAA